MSNETRTTQRRLLAYAALMARRYSQANMYLIAFALSAPSGCTFHSNSPSACAEQFSVEVK